MEESDHEIRRAVLAGDKDAYGTLVVRYSQTVFRVAFRSLARSVIVRGNNRRSRSHNPRGGCFAALETRMHPHQRVHRTVKCADRVISCACRVRRRLPENLIAKNIVSKMT